MKKKVLITGCSTGIGHDTAIYLHQQGWQVIATVRDENSQQKLTALGINTKYLDQNDPAQVEQLFTDPDLQELDCAYLNSGFGYVAASEDICREGLEKQFQTNVFGTWDCATRCLKIFRKQGHGRLLVCSSIIGFSPIPYRAAYGASKAALESLVQTARVEITNPNIQLSLLNPGPVITDFRPNAEKFFNIYTKPIVEQSYHVKNYEVQAKRLASTKYKRFTVTGLDCAKLIEKIFTSKRQKTNYLICTPTWAMYFAKRLLPVWLFEKFVRWTYNLEG